MKKEKDNWNWVIVKTLVVLSIFTILNKQGFKCRIYEDDYETSVYDFNNNIRRKIHLTNIK